MSKMNSEFFPVSFPKKHSKLLWNYAWIISVCFIWIISFVIEEDYIYIILFIWTGLFSVLHDFVGIIFYDAKLSFMADKLIIAGRKMNWEKSYEEIDELIIGENPDGAFFGRIPIGITIKTQSESVSCNLYRTRGQKQASYLKKLHLLSEQNHFLKTKMVFSESSLI